CSEIDSLGREVSTAVPGDSLSGTGTRDPACPAGGGPTSWARDLGLGGPGRPGAAGYAQNGLAPGEDGQTLHGAAGRAIESCSQVDPATNDNHPEVCSTTTYDSMGRAATVSIPFYNDNAGAQVVDPPAGLQYTATQYDALGRVVRTELVGSGIPATTMSYE